MRARVYRNLNNGLWSIQQKVDGKWVVVGHAASCALTDVTVRQSEAARQKVIANQCRSVHCWVEGWLIRCSDNAGFKGRTPETMASFNPSREGLRQVTYNPYRHKTLVYAATEEEYTGSKFAFFGSDQKMYAC